MRRSKKSTILEFDEDEQDEFFENTWLSTSMNELDKKMIAEHETIIRRKVRFWVILERRRDEKSTRLADCDYYLLRL